jgi:hypothetical protein
MRITVEIRRPRWLTSTRLKRARPLVLLLALALASPVLASDTFSDVPTSNVHHDDINLIRTAGITQGCNPPDNDQYCPADFVRRDQMGSFLARTAGLGANPPVADADKLDGMDSTDFYAHGDAVPSGETIFGAVGADFHAYDATASDFGVDVSLPLPAPVGLTDDDVFVNVTTWTGDGSQTTPTTTDTDPGCDGTLDTPTAPAGKVCIYVSGADHAFNLNGYSVRFGTEASKYGFKLKWDASTQGDTFVDAVWAYTAP